ncbi:hypothetical protein DOTSEDRAFT_39859 [Dothistroma septosporum NZE10]|uniref:EVE domain-containing protein n=1 Tax=Dothistroma septosporum (strain NZE10 / CBS 128990) TaxID=675120 RepID=N1PYC2_DOTSN|nr:hypothetical protein DOTSEDRAFT_39859 [Dothistroma septosporum NZE10]
MKVMIVLPTANDDDDTEQDREQTSSGINYWLMKAEQDGHDVTVEGGTTVNTTFTIDDLRAKAEPEPWDGVRNPKAAMNMRNMRVGDMAFFYASGGKQGRKPGITGIMEIVSKAEPDATVNDPRSAGYVVKEADRKKWVAVRVEFRKKLSKPVHLTELQQYKNAELKDLQEFTAARLSVSKVSEKEWTFIYNLIEGFDDVGKAGDLDGELEAQVAGPSGAILLTEDTTFIVTEQPNGDVVAEGQTDDIVEKELDLPKGYAPPAIMQTTEPELPTTDTIFPDATSATERSASRTGSHRSSRAPSATRLGVNSSRPGSRARSLAPPTARGRSRTPGARGGSVGPPLPGMNEDLTGFLDSVAEVNEL